MFSINENNKIKITKGDNAQMVVSVFDKYGNKRKLWSDDTITLTVRKGIRGNVVLEKNAIDGVIDFIPADTSALTSGLYFYDIQLITFGGKVYTIIPVSIFEIGEEITL